MPREGEIEYIVRKKHGGDGVEGLHGHGEEDSMGMELNYMGMKWEDSMGVEREDSMGMSGRILWGWRTRTPWGWRVRTQWGWSGRTPWGWRGKGEAREGI